MTRFMRFGRKVSNTPTAIIKHELRLMMATDTLLEVLHNQPFTSAEAGQVVGGLMSTHGISLDRAPRLMDRLRVDRSFLAAHPPVPDAEIRP